MKRIYGITLCDLCEEPIDPYDLEACECALCGLITCASCLSEDDRDVCYICQKNLEMKGEE